MTNEPAVGITMACSSEGVAAAARPRLRYVLPRRRPCSAVALSWCLPHISKGQDSQARRTGVPPPCPLCARFFSLREQIASHGVAMSDSTLTSSLVPFIAKMGVVASKSTLRTPKTSTLRSNSIPRMYIRVEGPQDYA